MGHTVSLPAEDWKALLEFASRMAKEIAFYDPEDEEYVAVSAALRKIEKQLEDGPTADIPHLVILPHQAR